jgi:hypothetical protein
MARCTRTASGRHGERHAANAAGTVAGDRGPPQKALMTEDRQSSREPVKSQSTEAEKPERQARQLPGAVQGTSSRGETSPQGRKWLSLGMTQDEVRRTLGEPSSIENAGAYVFWQYSETRLWPFRNQPFADQARAGTGHLEIRSSLVGRWTSRNYAASHASAMKPSAGCHFPAIWLGREWPKSSEMSNQKYVIFGKLSGQVTGWRAL